MCVSGVYAYQLFGEEPAVKQRKIQFSASKKQKRIQSVLTEVSQNCQDEKLYSQMRKRLLYLYQVELDDVRFILRRDFPLETLEIEHEFGYLLYRLRKECSISTVFNFIKNSFKSLFEFSSVFGTSQQ